MAFREEVEGFAFKGQVFSDYCCLYLCQGFNEGDGAIRAREFVCCSSRLGEDNLVDVAELCWVMVEGANCIVYAR